MADTHSSFRFTQNEKGGIFALGSDWQVVVSIEQPGREELNPEEISKQIISKLRKKLLTCLKEIRDIDNFQTRSYLLHNLDSEGLERHKTNTRVDLAYILNHAIELDKVDVLIENAKYLAESRKETVRKLEIIHQEWVNFMRQILAPKGDSGSAYERSESYQQRNKGDRPYEPRT